MSLLTDDHFDTFFISLTINFFFFVSFCLDKVQNLLNINKLQMESDASEKIKKKFFFLREGVLCCLCSFLSILKPNSSNFCLLL